MVYDYIVSVKNERNKYVNTISIFVCMISVAFFINQQIKTRQLSLLLFIPTLLILAGLGWNRYQAGKNDRIVYYRRILILTGVVWLMMPFMQGLAVPFILLAFLEKSARMPLEVGVINDGVVIHSLLKRAFSWSDLNNIILKDGLLTLDFKNNRLFQKEIVESADDIIEYEFNEYCKNHLATVTTNQPNISHIRDPDQSCL
jgi:hypothetical protein